MKAKLLLTLITGLFISGNCLAVATKVNRGPIHARTFSFVTRTSKADPTIADNREAVHKMVQNAITRNLAARAVSRVESQVTTARNGDNTICLSVRDQGGGIPPEIRQQLFDQFFTTKEKGLGMGLSIVRSIVEAHGGKIEAENDGGGARFSFTLPID